MANTDSLDSEGKKELPQADFYFEPKFLSDVQITYLNCVFHLHKCILAVDSIYFNNIFEQDRSCTQIELIHLNEPIFNTLLTIFDLNQFFSLFYRKGIAFSETDVTCHKDCAIIGDTHCTACIKLEPLRFGFLFSYFQMPRFEMNLRSCITSFGKRWNFQSRLRGLILCYTYKYENEKPIFIENVAEVPLFYTYKEWELLPNSIREAVYQKALANKSQ
jgi:hypothetical protein